VLRSFDEKRGLDPCHRRGGIGLGITPQ
jgi:hypothetical protein